MIVEANGASVQTYALLDNGCDKTLVTDRLVSALGVEGSPVDFTISGVDIDSVPYRGKQVDLKVRPLTAPTCAVRGQYTRCRRPTNRCQREQRCNVGRICVISK